MHAPTLALLAALLAAAVDAAAQPQASRVPTGFIGIPVPPIVSSVVGDNLPTIAPSLLSSYFSDHPGAATSEAESVLCYFQSHTKDVAALSALSSVGVYRIDCGGAAQQTSTANSGSSGSSTLTTTSTTLSTSTSSGAGTTAVSTSSGTTTQTSVVPGSVVSSSSSSTSNPGAVQTPFAVGGAVVAGLLGVVAYL